MPSIHKSREYCDSFFKFCILDCLFSAGCGGVSSFFLENLGSTGFVSAPVKKVIATIKHQIIDISYARRGSRERVVSGGSTARVPPVSMPRRTGCGQSVLRVCWHRTTRVPVGRYGCGNIEILNV